MANDRKRMVKILPFLALITTAHAWDLLLGWIQPEPGQHVWEGIDGDRAAGWRVYVQEPTGPRQVLDVPNYLGQPAAVTVPLPDGPQTITVVAYDDDGDEAAGASYTVIPARIEQSEDLQTWRVIGYADTRPKDFVRITP